MNFTPHNETADVLKGMGYLEETAAVMRVSPSRLNNQPKKKLPRLIGFRKVEEIDPRD